MQQLNITEYNPDDDYEPHEHDALQYAMRKQWEYDLERIAERGVVPDWVGEPKPLSKDKARLLELLYDLGCVVWGNNPTSGNVKVTKSMGFLSQSNAKSCIDACLKDGLVSCRVYNGDQIFELATKGEYALEEHQLDVELGILSL